MRSLSKTGSEPDLRAAVLDAAGELYYAHGVHAVGVDAVRAASGVSLRRLYQLFPAKETLVAAWLRRRDAHWRARLAAYVDGVDGADARVLAVFDWLGVWFAEPGFRGCAFVNTFGELGAESEPVVREVRLHKELFAGYVGELVAAAGHPPWLADHLVLLAEGAMTTAAITGTPEPARQAREAAAQLLHLAARRS